MSRPRDYAAAAAELGVSEEWLREMTPRVPLPHSKFAVAKSGEISQKGRGPVVFYDDDIAEIRKMFAVRAADSAPRRSGPVTRRRAS